MKQPETLDSFSKVLIGTGAINYMVATLNSTMLQMAFIDSDTARESIREKQKLFSEVVKKIGGIMEDLGNYMNTVDCISPIDERATYQAFQIIIHGQDKVQEGLPFPNDPIPTKPNGIY